MVKVTKQINTHNLLITKQKKTHQQKQNHKKIKVLT